MKKKPHWAIDRVQALVKIPGGLFIQKTRALDFFDSLAIARATVLQVIEGLTLRDFAHTVQLTYDVADVYGVRLNGDGWYLKLTIEEQTPGDNEDAEVAVISFHPLERPLTTNGGVIKP